MDTTMASALAIPWVFWGILAGPLFAAGRSWINMLLLPVGFTVLILAIAHLSSTNEAFWFSVISHLALLVFFLKSYVSFIRKQRKKE